MNYFLNKELKKLSNSWFYNPILGVFSFFFLYPCFNMKIEVNYSPLPCYGNYEVIVSWRFGDLTSDLFAYLDTQEDVLNFIGRRVMKAAKRSKKLQ